MAGLLDPGDDVDAQIGARLATATVAWLASTRPDGRPHAVPVWFAWADPDAVLFTQPRSGKVGNLRLNPACTLAPETADGGNDVVIVEGTAALLPPDEAAALAESSGFVAKYAPLMGDGGFDAWITGFPQPVVIRASRILAWAKPGGRLRFKELRP